MKIGKLHVTAIYFLHRVWPQNGYAIFIPPLSSQQGMRRNLGLKLQQQIPIHINSKTQMQKKKVENWY